MRYVVASALGERVVIDLPATLITFSSEVAGPPLVRDLHESELPLVQGWRVLTFTYIGPER